MALVAVGRVLFPEYLVGMASQSTTFGSNTIVLDSDTDRVAWVGRASITDTLTTIYFRTSTVTTGCTVDVRVETVTNGRPSGTLFAANTAASVVIADGDDNVWKTATLTAAASLTVEDEFAIIITVDTAGATPNLQLTVSPSNLNNTGGLYPVCLLDAGAGTWASAAFAFDWILQYGTAGVIPTSGMIPVNGGGTLTAFNSGSTDDEIALRFQVPFKCRCSGARVFMGNITAAGDFTISLWPASSDDDTDALAQVTEDGDVVSSATADCFVEVPFSPVTLDINTTYYLGLRADTANNISIGELTTATVANAILAFPGVSAQMYRSRRAWTAGTAGAWTDTTTTLPLINLIIDQLDDGAGGGGGGQRVIGG